jgi:vacuolar-type H+-ATPase subunit I/STV1
VCKVCGVDARMDTFDLWCVQAARELKKELKELEAARVTQTKKEAKELEKTKKELEELRTKLLKREKSGKNEMQNDGSARYEVAVAGTGDIWPGSTVHSSAQLKASVRLAGGTLKQGMVYRRSAEGYRRECRVVNVGDVVQHGRPNRVDVVWAHMAEAKEGREIEYGAQKITMARAIWLEGSVSSFRSEHADVLKETLDDVWEEYVESTEKLSLKYRARVTRCFLR